MARSKHHREDQPDSEWRKKGNKHKYGEVRSLAAMQKGDNEEKAAKLRETRQKASAKYVEEQTGLATRTEKRSFFTKLFKRRKVG